MSWRGRTTRRWAAVGAFAACAAVGAGDSTLSLWPGAQMKVKVEDGEATLTMTTDKEGWLGLGIAKNVSEPMDGSQVVIAQDSSAVAEYVLTLATSSSGPTALDSAWTGGVAARSWYENGERGLELSGTSIGGQVFKLDGQQTFIAATGWNEDFRNSKHYKAVVFTIDFEAAASEPTQDPVESQTRRATLSLRNGDAQVAFVSTPGNPSTLMSVTVDQDKAGWLFAGVTSGGMAGSKGVLYESGATSSFREMEITSKSFSGLEDIKDTSLFSDSAIRDVDNKRTLSFRIKNSLLVDENSVVVAFGETNRVGYHRENKEVAALDFKNELGIGAVITQTPTTLATTVTGTPTVSNEATPVPTVTGSSTSKSASVTLSNGNALVNIESVSGETTSTMSVAIDEALAGWLFAGVTSGGMSGSTGVLHESANGDAFRELDITSRSPSGLNNIADDSLFSGSKVESVDGKRVLTFKIDNSLLTEENSVVVAHGASSIVAYHGSNRDVAAVNFAEELGVGLEESSAPTSTPTLNVTAAPTSAPTVNVTLAPTTAPTVNVTAAPTSAPTVNVTLAPTTAPTVNVTAAPTSTPTVNVTLAPTTAPTVNVTTAPTSTPTVNVTTAPTTTPTTLVVNATEVPTTTPVINVTDAPTTTPLTNATEAPTATPIINTTEAPTTTPIVNVTEAPTATPVVNVTEAPTATPVVNVTEAPTATPVVNSTEGPTTTPVINATEVPTTTPVINATEVPTTTPVINATEAPTTTPVINVTEAPTATPIVNTTEAPTTTPIVNTTEAPTTTPIINTTEAPTTTPVVNSTEGPTTTPVINTTEAPTTTPVINVTEAPTTKPVINATEAPTTTPVINTTNTPTATPSANVTEAPTSSPTSAPKEVRFAMIDDRAQVLMVSQPNSSTTTMSVSVPEEEAGWVFAGVTPSKMIGSLGVLHETALENSSRELGIASKSESGLVDLLFSDLFVDTSIETSDGLLTMKFLINNFLLTKENKVVVAFGSSRFVGYHGENKGIQPVDFATELGITKEP